MVELKTGIRIPFPGFVNTIETDKGAIVYSGYTCRDGYIIYESVEQNTQKCPKVFVVQIVGHESVGVVGVIEMNDNDTLYTAYGRIEAIKNNNC